MDGESKSLNQQNPEMLPDGKKKWNDRERKKREAEEDVDGGWRGGNQSFQSFLIMRLHSQER